MTDQPLTLDQFLDRLDIGEYDEHLKEITERADERYNLIKKRTLRTLKQGDQLRFLPNTSPKYLHGKVVEYIEPFPKPRSKHPWAVVKAPNHPDFGRFAGNTFRAPMNTLEKVDP